MMTIARIFTHNPYRIVPLSAVPVTGKQRYPIVYSLTLHWEKSSPFRADNSSLLGFIIYRGGESRRSLPEPVKPC